MPNEGLLMFSLSSICYSLFLDTFGPSASDQQERRNVNLPREDVVCKNCLGSIAAESPAQFFRQGLGISSEIYY